MYPKKRRNRLAGAACIVIVFSMLLSLPAPFLAKNGGFPDGDIDTIDGGSCAGAFGCHTTFDNSQVPISMSFNPVPPYTPGQTGIQVTVNVDMDGANGGSETGVSLRVGPTGANSRLGIENDGWVITNDPNGGTNNFIQQSGLVGAGPTNLVWTVTAPSAPGTYYVEPTVQYDNGGPGQEHNRAPEQTITVSPPADSQPPNINNVLIDGLSVATYTLSALPPSVVLTATIDDSGTGGSNIGGANYTTPTATSWPGTGMNAVTPPFDNPVEDVTATITTPTIPGTYNYYVYGWDNVPNYNNNAPFATLVINDDLPPDIANVLIDGQATATYGLSTLPPSVTLMATIDDTASGGTNVGGANYTTPTSTSWPGTSMTAVAPPFDNPSEDVTANIVSPSIPGTYNYYIYGWDDSPNYNNTAPFATLVVNDDLPPEISNVRVDGQISKTVIAGTIVTLNATADDTNTGNSNVAGANYTIGPAAWPSTDMNAVAPPFDNPTEDVTQTVDTSGWSSGSYELYVYAWDDVPNNNLTSTEFATIIIAAELLPPEISNVLINGAPSQTYPMSAIPVLTLTADVDDSNTGASDVGGANYTIGAQQWGTSQPMSLQNPPTSPTEVMEATIPAPTQAGTYVFYVYAWDSNLNSNNTNIIEFATLTIIDDLPPEVSNVLVDGLATTTVTEGTIVTLNATIDDSNTGNSNVSGANYTIGMAMWPGTPMNAVTPPFDNPTEDVTQTIDTTGWPDGSYDVYVYARDEVPNDNSTSAAFATITILTDSTPPEVTEVFIDGLTVASYPLSALPPSVTLTATIDDTNTGGLFVAGANYTNPTSTSWPGTPMSPVLAPFDNSFEEVSATFIPPTIPGTYNYYVYGWDNGPNYNNSAPFATLVITDDLPPEVSMVRINGASTLTVQFSSIPALTLTANLDDSSNGNSNIGGGNYTTPSSTSWPGISMNAVVAPFDSPIEEVTSTLSAPAAPGTYNYYVHAWDSVPNINTTAPFATLVVEDDIAPEVSNVLVDGLTTTTVSGGTSVTLTATIDDSGTGNSNVGGANYTSGAQGWPSTSMNAVTPPFDAPSEDVTVDIDTTGWSPASYDIYVYAWDSATPSQNNNLTSTAFATIVISPPGVNNAPTLNWTGETDYSSDGLNPETGEITTTFTYRVKYADIDNDAPASGGPKLHIEKGGVEVSGSPFNMTYISGSNDTGAIYSYSLTLAEGSDYTYYFTASDGTDSATGAPTAETNGPSVIVVDVTPPAAPENPGVTTPSERGRLVIGWNANTESDLAGYNVYRSATSGTGYQLVGIVDASMISYVDHDLADGTTYYYVITAIDSSGHESPHSDEVGGKTKSAPQETQEDPLWLILLVVIIIVGLVVIFLIMLLKGRRKTDSDMAAEEKKGVETDAGDAGMNRAPSEPNEPSH
jgi:hypothetical protein